ncbi:ATP-dependent sacrificial sulfur transferase LarE [Pseudodesulfovibrio tunisiensis]|uniref:ATP-dependent sacrificial sulfur transferase LarE n=1 Tax=Pseudodesulfovibrio tunisiensis TaxID=463192 RepID=UPI001FB24D1D|nr:ATP-dependent sacrificial sulfur transferase LarE [Pseudodesulfovibrio tunisiensis]
MALRALQEYLVRLGKEHDRVLIAFSGGVDSSAVACVAHRALPGRARAVTANTGFQSASSLEQARDIAAGIGIPHQEVRLDLLADPAIAANGPDRCYLCKRAVFASIRSLGDHAAIVDGTNADDDPARPGRRALRELGVLSPLESCGLSKDMVRDVAKELKLPNHDAPSDSCLATRIPVNIRLSRRALDQVECMEKTVKNLGVTRVRARCDDLVTTVEFPARESRIMQKNGDMVRSEARRLGFADCRFREWDA